VGLLHPLLLAGLPGALSFIALITRQEERAQPSFLSFIAPSPSRHSVT
jgi:hypothetical protein